MPFSLENQLKLLGAQVFEELCAQLIGSDKERTYHIDGRSGDEGIDIFCGPLDLDERARTGEKLHVWQVKFFPTGLGQSQRKQVVHSLQRVVEARKPDSWTLCVPVELRPDDYTWLTKLREKYPVSITEPMEASCIVQLALKPANTSLLGAYFLIPSDIDTSDKVLKRLDHFELVGDLLESGKRLQKTASEFYEGAVADWHDIVHELDAYREKTGEAWEFVRRSVIEPGGRVPFALVTGRSGEGKSTLLMRLACELVRSDYKAVYYHKSHLTELSPDQFKELPDDAVVFVFIDRITRFDVHKLVGFFEALRYIPIRPVVIGAAIESLWEGLGCNLENVANLHRVELNELSDKDIEALLDKLSEDTARANANLGKLAGLTREEQVQRFRSRAGRQLLVALLEAKRNESFEGYVERELEDLADKFGPIVRRACIYVSALHRLDLTMPGRMLTTLLPKGTRLADDVLRRTRGLVQLLPEGENIVTRHPLIADVIYRHVEDVSPTWYDEIIEVAHESEERLIARMVHTIRLAGDRSLAGRLLDAAAQQFPGNVVFLQMHATLCREEGNVNAARDFFRKGVEADPKNAPLWQGWALLEKDERNVGKREDPEEYSARWLFRKGVEADPKHAPLWQAWALLEKDERNVGKREDPEEYSARWLFRKGVEADPKHAPLWQAWALLEKDERNVGKREDPEEYSARWLFRKGVEADPKNAPLWQAWALLEKDERNLPEAERLCVKAVSAAADARQRSWAYCDLSSVLVHLQHWEADALKYLELAVEEDPENYIAHARLGRSYGYLSRWEESERHFKESLRVKPNNEKTRQLYENMLRARRKYSDDGLDRSGTSGPARTE